MAETSPKASPKKAATKTVAAAKTKSASKAKPAELETAAPVSPPPTAAKAAPAPAAVKASTPKKTSTAKTPTAKSKSVAKAIVLSDEQRYRMVAEAAYYRAEKNQFKSDPLRDWIDAENDISALLNGDNK